MNKKKFWLDNVLATGFIFLLMVAFVNITAFKIFDLFDPIGEALGDLDLTDYAFNEIREEPVADTNIVVINFANLPRREIAKQIMILNQYEPAAIGIDAFFYRPKPDTLGDLMLASALADVKNLVMVSKLVDWNENTETFDSIATSHPMFMGNATQAISNLITDAEFQEDLKTVRMFPTQRTVDEQSQIAFGLELARTIKPEAVERFLERDNDTEYINFRGNVLDPFNKAKYKNQFYVLDWMDVFNENFTPELIKGKILIMGYLGNDLSDPSWADKFFTPLNSKIAGRANPDMFGVVVHANIASMVLYENPVNSIGGFWAIVLAVIICFLNVTAFSWIYYNLPRWYDGITKLIQLVEIIFLTVLVVMVFSYQSLKLDLTVAIFAVVLVSDSLEIYFGVVKNLFNRDERRRLFKLQNRN